MFMVCLLGICGKAFLPSTVWFEQEQQGMDTPRVPPVRHAMFGAAMPLDAFVTLDGGTAHVAAVQQYGPWGETGGWLLRKIHRSMEDIQASGWGPLLDPELVMLLQPDAVFSWKGREGALRAMGLPQLVELQNVRGSQVESHLELWFLFGRLLGRQDKARQLAQRYTEMRADLERALAGLSHPSVLLIVGGHDAGYWLPSNHHYDERFAQLGARPLHKGLFGGKANLENVLLLDPDVIFLDASVTGDQLVPAQLYSQPEWQALRAVRDRRVYRMPDLPRFSIPVEDPIRLQWLAEILYPEILPATTRQQIADTVMAAYDYRMSEDDIDTLLDLQANRASYAYQRFARQKN